ncbi:MAG: hypothetical protein LC648_03525 [Novosphingobium sp.]|nr:hypothetical protein [Novosphingobium sp.]
MALSTGWRRVSGVLWRLTMRIAILFAPALLTACASPGDDRFPSLATRPGERVTGTIEPAPAPVPPPATAATGSRIAQLRGQAQAAHRKFEERRGGADALSRAAQGAAVASEAWSVAQVALASLESARSEAMIALADLDSLYIAAQDAAVPTGGSGDVDAVAAARGEVIALIGEEDAALAAYRGRLNE